MRRDLIRLKDAVVLLELMLAGRMTREQRERTEAAITDLRMAQVDPAIRREMHTHPSKRAS